MSDFVHLELMPLGKVLRVKRGTPLQDVLFAHGVEFPCGGRGRCKGCKIKVLAGALPITEEEKQRLSGAELADGWRMACRGRAESGGCGSSGPRPSGRDVARFPRARRWREANCRWRCAEWTARLVGKRGTRAGQSLRGKPGWGR